VAAVAVAALSACASGNNFVSDVVGGLVTDQFRDRPDPTLGVALNPDFRYLRVEVAGRPPALLVLGYLDAHADGEIEVWYTAEHEVIKTQNGRIVGTFGLETDWRAVRLLPALPPWAGEQAGPVQFQRLRDQMPGYRYSMTEQVESSSWPGVPPQGVSKVLVTVPREWKWFREVVVGGTEPVRLPPAWFARGRWGGRDTVVYSEQCLSPDLCMRLMRWPLQGQSG